MKKAILKKFILILLIALTINSAISCILVSQLMLKNTKEDLLFSIQVLDSALDYEKDLREQIYRIQQRISNQNIRFTVITLEGEVCADTTIGDTEQMVNHKEREEFQQAIEQRIGYARRYSETLGMGMFYVAALSQNEQYFLRVSVPFSGMTDYIKMLLPMVMVSLLISVLIALFLVSEFTKTITRPLKEITREILKFNELEKDMEFQKYPYEELNQIASTAKDMEQDIKEYVNKLELEKKIRQEFFSNASHELKTPLTSIRGYTELIQNGMIQKEEMKEEFLERIHKETIHMADLIDDILMISRLETKETEVMMCEVKMDEILKEIIEILVPAAKENEIEITSECKEISYYANPQQMKELIGNLVTNAVKYNKIGGRVHISIGNVRDMFVIQVYDNGIGISQEDVGRIFERFYRAEKGRSKKISGTGLGLSIVKHIVMFYDGKIEVESKIDIGTTFTIYLPIRKTE